jgi:Family of unknown function (DUF5694)
MQRGLLLRVALLGTGACMLAACAPAQHTSSLAAPAAQQPALPTGFPVSCAPGEVEVMLLGTYHFANPGRDDIKLEVDDVLEPRRQAEIEDVVARLARWQPDLIAVEWPFNFADSTRARFGRYVAGTLPPNRDEVVQIGFRLAKRLGHATVYPIDQQMLIGNDSIGPLFARRPELKRSADSVQARLQARADSAAPLQRRQSILERLREANSDDALHGGNSEGMFGALLPAGEGDNYGGPQMLARWYERNIRMVYNLYRSLRPSARRVLLVVGNAHVPPLRSLLDDAPQFCPVSPLPYLR